MDGEGERPGYFEGTGEESGVNPYWMGERLIAAGLLTETERDHVLMRQSSADLRGKHIRFGELAVELGFCTPEQVENLPGYLGEKLVTAGLLTVSQRQLLITWQRKLRGKGIHIRFGDLTVSEGFCTAAEIEAVV